ncbi:MAG: UDP-N-acetylglucosamine 2-epimerase [bacterium]|nr:UDP-N-acetylglucosamine 2-epimerase [bacterium]
MILNKIFSVLKNGTERRKICFVITSKIHYSRSKLILLELKKREERDQDVTLQVIVAASALIKSYGDVEELMKKDGLPISARITMALEGGNTIAMAKTTGLGVIEFTSVFENLNPDVVVLRGDRFEVLSAAVAAAYMNKTIAHIEGGDVTGSIDESIRHAITKFSHLHFVTNEESRRRVIRMGEQPHYVFNVGASDVEFASLATGSITNDDIHKVGEGREIDISEQFIIVMQHPVTTEFNLNSRHMEETLYALESLKVPTILIWSNTDAGADEITSVIRRWRTEKGLDHYVRFVNYIEPSKFMGLLRKAACVVGNSSSGIKECSYLGTPVVNIGTRQAGRMRGNNVTDVPHSREKIIKAIEQQLQRARPYAQNTIYHMKDSSKIIARKLSKVPLYTQKFFAE